MKSGAHLIKDEEGVDLPTPDHARAEALQSARELWADAIKAGRDLRAGAFVIADEEGKQLILCLSPKYCRSARDNKGHFEHSVTAERCVSKSEMRAKEQQWRDFSFASFVRPRLWMTFVGGNGKEGRCSRTRKNDDVRPRPTPGTEGTLASRSHGRNRPTLAPFLCG
jgi:hypothetical protein